MKKKNNLFAIIVTMFLIVVVLSWIIPLGAYSAGNFSKGVTSPIGIIDLFRSPLLAIANFIHLGFAVLAIGGFYGVLNKTEVYTKMVNKLVDKQKGKEKKFLMFTLIFFSLLSALSGQNLLLFILVPFFVTVLILIGYDRLTTFASTIGAILIGNIGSIYGFQVAGYTKNFFNLNINGDIFAKIILFIIVSFLFITLVVSKAKLDKKSKKEDKNIMLYDDSIKDNKKSVLPLIIVSSIAFIFLLIGTYNWSYSFGIDIFSKLYESIIGLKIGNYPILANILGEITEIGYFSGLEIAITLTIFSFIIAWIYSLKLDSFKEGFKSGMKEILPVAILVVIANVIFNVMLYLSDGNYVATIAHTFMGSKFNIFTTALSTAIGSFFYNDLYYLLNSLSGLFLSYEAVYYPIIAIITGSLTSVFMVILPTSIILLAGMRLVDVSFKEWIKYIYKYVIEVILVVLIIAVILFQFV